MQFLRISDLQKYFIGVGKLLSKNKTYIFRKYLPTTLMFLLSAYIYSLLRGVKDAILVPNFGAEIISYIKFYGVFPATLIFFVCFSKLANILSRDKLYYVIAMFFASFFMLYAFVLGPNSEFFHLDLSNLVFEYPSFRYQIMMIQNWTISLFYVMSELCGTVMLTLLFWQLANDLYNIKEAKKTYPLFGLVGQLGLVIAGVVQSNVSVYFEDPSDHEAWDATIKWMMLSIFVVCLGLIAIYRWMYKNVLFDSSLCDRKHDSEREKIKLSIIESFKYVFSSRYLWLIMVIVFCYGVGVNMIEIVWKDQLRLQYVSNSNYSAFMGKFHIIFGFSTIATMLFGAYIIRKFKWIVAALFTPIGAGFTGVIFFNVIMFRDLFGDWFSQFDINLLSMAIMIGSLQVMLFKSFNYAFVDATKEMAFIPLDRELRIKGKAAVDVIGGRFGKAFGAVLQQLMFQFISPNISDLTYEIFIVFVVTMTMWVLAVIALNKEFYKLTKN